ncbi:hypothetical protein, partial [Vibrio mediterranei]|uniref:hypothetical protein n=1 Tax=Vibrio mediterranei TaxID=689 RepID=UPI001EFC57B1
LNAMPLFNHIGVKGSSELNTCFVSGGASFRRSMNVTCHALVLVLSLSSISQARAANLLNKEEQRILNDITENYDTSYAQLGIRNNQNEVDRLEAEKRYLEIKLQNERSKLKDESDKLEYSLLNGEYDEDRVDKLHSLSFEIASVNNKLTRAISSLKSEQISLEKLSSKLDELNHGRTSKLIKLYDEIKKRYSSASGIVYSKSYNGDLTCDLTESLTRCLAKNMGKIKETFYLVNGGREQINIEKFELSNATQELSGKVFYTVDVEYSKKLTSRLEYLIQKEIGLNQVSFTLQSNKVKTDFFIDGILVGSGKKVDVFGPYLGQHEIKAVNNKHVQSSIINLSQSENYYFPFKKNNPENKDSNDNRNKTGSLSETSLSVKDAFSGGLLKKGWSYKYNNTDFFAPVFLDRDRQRAIYLDYESAMSLCNVKFGGQLLSSLDYSNLESITKLESGEYWTNSGAIYSTYEHKNVAKTFLTNRVVCSK